MNDDFLKQHRPPIRAEFAKQLKQKLDRQSESPVSAGIWTRVMEMFTMKTNTTFRRLAVAAAALVIAFSTLFVASPQVRAAARNFLVQVAGMTFSTETNSSLFGESGPNTGVIVTPLDTPSALVPAQGVPGTEISGTFSVIQIGGPVSGTQANVDTTAAVSMAEALPVLTHEQVKAAGVKLPTAVPNGYKAAGATIIQQTAGSRDIHVEWMKDERHHLSLMVQQGQANKSTFEAPGGQVKEVQLKNKTVAVVQLSAKDGMAVYGANIASTENNRQPTSIWSAWVTDANPNAKPMIVQWKEGNDLYLLSDFSGALSQEELLAIAESVQ